MSYLLKYVHEVSDIKDGDNLLIYHTSPDGNDGTKPDVDLYKNVKIQILDSGSHEVILEPKNNKYFNLNMYLIGKSWIKQVFVIRP